MTDIKRQIVKNEQEWHALRRQHITASESSMLLGLDSYGSPSKVRKIKEEGESFVGNAYTIIGQILEPAVIDMTNRVLGTKFKQFETEEGHKTFDTRGFLGSTPDAHEKDWLLECKTTRPVNYVKYSAAPPLKYLMQLQTQMWCADVKQGYLAIMSTNLTQNTATMEWPISVFQCKRNDALCKMLAEEAERFFNYKAYKVNTLHKKRAKLLLSLSMEKIV